MSRVPIEVFEVVIDQADTPSLHHLSLTCKTFLPRARYHLFSSILIHTIQQMECSRDFFDSIPWIFPLVRKVVLSVLVPPNSSTRNVPMLDIVPHHLLSKCPNLRMWTIGVSQANTTGIPSAPAKTWLSLNRFALSYYQRYGGRIQNLELFDIPFDDISDFTGLVSAVNGIQSLVCSHIRFRTAKELRTFGSLYNARANAVTVSSKGRSRLLKIKSLQVSFLIVGVIFETRY